MYALWKSMAKMVPIHKSKVAKREQTDALPERDYSYSMKVQECGISQDSSEEQSSVKAIHILY